MGGSHAYENDETATNKATPHDEDRDKPDKDDYCNANPYVLTYHCFEMVCFTLILNTCFSYLIIIYDS